MAQESSQSTELEVEAGGPSSIPLRLVHKRGSSTLPVVKKSILAAIEIQDQPRSRSTE